MDRENPEEELASQGSYSSDAEPDAPVQYTRLEAFQGPLPSPDDFAQYERVLPGAAERILLMSERQAEHRYYVEKTIVGRSTVGALLGIAAATLVSLAVLGIAGYALHLGQPLAGGLLGVADVVGLVGVYIYGTRSRESR